MLMGVFHQIGTCDVHSETELFPEIAKVRGLQSRTERGDYYLLGSYYVPGILHLYRIDS